MLIREEDKVEEKTTYRNAELKGEKMNFEKYMEERFSCRSFSEKEVEPDILKKVANIALKAPSARNKQPWKVYIFSGEKALKDLAQATNCTFNANAAFVICYKTDEEAVRPYDDHHYGATDAAILTTHLMYILEDHGLKSCWVGNFEPAKLKPMITSDESIVPLAILPLGYPGEKSKPSSNHEKRKTFEEVFELYNLNQSNS